jgi:GNAT superfamily N-acetyltransferase
LSPQPRHAGGPVSVRPVASRKDVQPFWRVGIEAQGDDPAYTPPLLKELFEVLTPHATPFAKANDGRAWVAFRDGRPVGRIYAVKHHAHLEKHRDGAGHFGFLEAVDDDAVWDALFEAASAFLRERGLTRIAGPFSASVNHECGLLVEGHGARATTHTNYAPPYYTRQLARLGFAAVKDMVGYEGRLADSRLPERVATARAQWRDDARLVLRPAIGPTAVASINAVYNDAWSDNWGSVPISLEETRFLAELAQGILPRDWTTLAYWEGEAIGVLCMAPDLNEATRDLKGRLAPFGWAKLLWRLKVSGVARARVPIIGVRRAYRGTRVGAMAAAALLADAVAKGRAAGLETLEISWMLEENRPIINLVRGMPAKRTKVWRIFGKDL